MPKFYSYSSQALAQALLDRNEADWFRSAEERERWLNGDELWENEVEDAAEAAGVCVICVPLKGWCCVPHEDVTEWLSSLES